MFGDKQVTCKGLLGVMRLCCGGGLRVLGLPGTGADKPHLDGGFTVAVQHNPAGSNSMSTGSALSLKPCLQGLDSYKQGGCCAWSANGPASCVTHR